MDNIGILVSKTPANKTTTMHLYPDDKKVIKSLSLNSGLTIPDAARIIIQLYVALVRKLNSEL